VIASTGGGGGTDWASLRVDQMWAMLASHDPDAHAELIGGWRQSRALVLRHIGRVREYRAGLAAAWDPARSEAAGAYFARLDALIANLEESYEAAVANQRAFTGATGALQSARREMAEIHREHAANEALLAAFDEQKRLHQLTPGKARGVPPRRPVPDGRQAVLEARARAVMQSLSSELAQAQSALVRPTPYEPDVTTSSRLPLPRNPPTAGGARAPVTTGPATAGPAVGTAAPGAGPAGTGVGPAGTGARSAGTGTGRAGTSRAGVGRAGASAGGAGAGGTIGSVVAARRGPIPAANPDGLVIGRLDPPHRSTDAGRSPVSDPQRNPDRTADSERAPNSDRTANSERAPTSGLASTAGRGGWTQQPGTPHGPQPPTTTPAVGQTASATTRPPVSGVIGAVRPLNQQAEETGRPTGSAGSASSDQRPPARIIPIGGLANGPIGGSISHPPAVPPGPSHHAGGPGTSRQARDTGAPDSVWKVEAGVDPVITPAAPEPPIDPGPAIGRT
jgi:hypothetical protein